MEPNRKIMTLKPSPRTERLVGQLFSPAEWEQATLLLLEEFGNTLQDTNEFGRERMHFAVLKLSEGDLKKLREAIELAKFDWRDALMAAGFGHDVHQHERWAEEVLSAST
jgi:hypothetical protein